MSRETDSPSSGPNGRGGAAYPSGTPPYGTPAVPDGGPDAGRSAARPEERKTETTLTTRIRINIPGSRPIPPVVVRKPVGDTENSDAGIDTQPPAPGTVPSARTPEPPAEPAPAAEEKASEWFAPRKSSAPKAGPGGSPSNGAGAPGGSAPSGAAPSGPRPGAGAAGGTGAPGGARPGGVVGSMNMQGGPRPGATNGAGLPGATGGPVAPGHGGGTGSFDVTEALASGPLGGGPRPGDEPRRDDLPYFSDNGGQHGYGGQGMPGGPNGGPAGPGGPSGFNGPGGPGAPGGRGGQQGPAGPTTGPVTGDGPLVPPMGGGPGAMGGAPGMHAPGGGLSDDTAILTPQKPAPEPGTPGYGNPADNVSGHTVTSGIPVVPPTAQNAPFGPGAHTDGPLSHTPPKLPEPIAQNVPSAPAPKKKKGRGKRGLLTGGVIVLAGGVYGAGLLMNHSDVPKGTTVLGVDIGGGTRDDAVKKLDDAFEDRVNKELKLTVGGKTVTLKPDQAGLQFDAAATVSEAAQSDYNPVSVVGSLFGQERVVEPVMPVDEEKLQAALENAAGGSGSVTEGTIKFDSGKAVAVYGKAGQGIEVAKSTGAVEEAYRTQVETGTAPAVPVATTTKQPTVDKAEVDRMMKEYAEPAMSANVVVRTDAARFIEFSPENSLWKFLRVKAVDGKLVDSPDLNALKELYGQTFDGVLITRGTGKKTAVTPQDVYVALRQALLSKTDRDVTIETNPS
ncbi:hypothetical protein [Streptomyces cupreus]|uniref:Peptidoglycan binding domain-containing protein n=1 Tax=Streptomyces cupreus TaxID=2759956 RepID=A0A7X1IY53_9ACTN|nr:hypothetical protein [Streptomyces cupreus]MBC2900686.1 hypothetical protein [Streptomyces cupreus]